MAKKKKARPKRRKRALLLFLILLAALVWFAPAIALKTPLRASILNRASADLEGTIQCKEISASWFSPIRLHHIVVVDAEGNQLATIPKISSSRTLFQIASDSMNLGNWKIEQPKLHVVLRNDGSNIEDLLEPLLNSEESSSPITCQIEIVEGTLDVLNGASGETLQCESVNAKIDIGHAPEKSMQIQLAAITHDAQGKGEMSIALAMPAQAEAASSGENQFSLSTSHLPLPPFSPLLARLVNESTLGGIFSGELTAHWQCGESIVWNVGTEGAIDSFQLSAPEWMGDDSLALSKVEISGGLESAGRGIEANNFNFQSEIAACSAHGIIPVDFFTHLAGEGIEGVVLPQEALQFSATLDMARLSQSLPHMLHMREDAKIQSGTLACRADIVQQEDATTLSMEVELADVRGRAAGREIIWNDPIRLQLTGEESGGQALRLALACQSSFLVAEGAMRPGSGSFTANGDLDKLAGMLRPLIELDEIQLAGNFATDGIWNINAKQQIEASADVVLQNFMIQMPGAIQWYENNLAASAQLVGHAKGLEIESIDEAALNITAGEDQLDIALKEPVSQWNPETALPLRMSLYGDLARWTNRIKPWVGGALDGWEIAGRVAAQGDAIINNQVIDLPKVEIDGEEIVVVGMGFFIEEPQIKLESSLTIDLDNQQLLSPATTFTSSSLAFQADGVKLHFPTGEPLSLEAMIDYRGDLDRLIRWTNVPGTQPTTHLVGLISGEVNASTDGASTQFQVTSDIENAEMYRFEALEGGGVQPAASANQWKKMWSEPRIQCLISGTYGKGGTSLQLDNIELQLPWIALDSEAAIEGADAQSNIRLTGQIEYDLAIVADRFREWLGDSVQITGQQVHAFSLQGPLKNRHLQEDPNAQNGLLIAPELSGRAVIGWDSIHLYGLTAGPSAVDAQLANGIVTIAPLDMPLSGGRFRCTPRIALNADPAMVHIGEGMLLERVSLDEEMCQNWIKYVAPLLAQATAAQGDLSVRLNHANLPLFHPAEGDVEGTLSLHSGRVGPGPMAQPFVVIAKQIKSILQGNPLQAIGESSSTWVELTEQDVPFRLVEGRVYHQGLTILIGDVAITTTGSVGLDQTIDMVAQVPLRREWVGQERYLAAIEGKVLSIPIRGTLDSPQIDSQVIQQLAGELLQGAAQGILENEIQNQLERLFGQ